MKTYTLFRMYETVDLSGVKGYFTGSEGHICDTLELPYNNNEPFKSSIPEGTYKCRVKFSKKFGRVFEVLNVEGRTDILIHIGNSAKDTQGCILVGEKHSDNGVIGSRLAMGQLTQILPNTFNLSIINLVKKES